MNGGLAPLFGFDFDAPFPGAVEHGKVHPIVNPDTAMRVGDLDLSDCGDCPLLAGLTDEQKLERVRSDRMIARCLSQRKAAMSRPARAQKRQPRCVEIDNIQGLQDADS